MSSSTFTKDYVEKAQRVFLRPQPVYPWVKIVEGTTVCTSPGRSQVMTAVAQNTFRGFHRIDKSRPGAKEVFIHYFIEQRPELLTSLKAITSRDELNRFANRLCVDLKGRLTNSSPSQLSSYNKIRKPVDLYLEHLTAMAEELGPVRERLTPFLFLPLDSQILAEPELFTESELAAFGLKRSSTYSEISSERTYAELQRILAKRAQSLSANIGLPFYPIYFDLVWNNRHRSGGGNLFLTNPG